MVNGALAQARSTTLVLGFALLLIRTAVAWMRGWFLIALGGCLAHGYGTLIGDMGTMLSGGQKQRVFIARALYPTRVVVAHRPETIRSADRVIRLDKGRVSKDLQVLSEEAEGRGELPLLT